MYNFYKEYNIIKHLSILDKAYGDKKDKAGLPIWMHALRMAQVADTKFHGDKNVRSNFVMAALYHDYLEDGGTYTNLKKHVNKDVIEAVILLTKKPGEVYADYIQKIYNSKNGLAIDIKVLDLMDHLIYQDENVKESLIKRYHKALKVLSPYRYEYLLVNYDIKTL